MEKIVDETVGDMEKYAVPIEKKINLTIKEAAEYSNIGILKPRFKIKTKQSM